MEMINVFNTQPKGKNDWTNERWITRINHERIWIKRKKHSYFKDSDDEYKKVKGTKKCVIKGTFKFKDYNNCLRKIIITV